MTSWAPVTTAVQMLGALRRQGWNGWYIHNHSAEAEDTLRQLKDPKLVMSPEYAFSVEKLPVFAEIEAAAKKYGVNMPVDTLSLGWASGMMLEAALKQCGRPAAARSSSRRCITSACRPRASIRIRSVDQGQPHRAASFTAYAWDRKIGSVKRITDWAASRAATSRR